MVRIVAEPDQLHAEVHYLVLHDVHSYLFFFSVATCRSDGGQQIILGVTYLHAGPLPVSGIGFGHSHMLCLRAM